LLILGYRLQDDAVSRSKVIQNRDKNSYGRRHTNDCGESSGGLFDSSYSAAQCEKPRETLIMTAGPQIPEARYWLVNILGVTKCVLHGHTPTQEGIPIRCDFSHAVASLVNAAWFVTAPVRKDFFLASGGKICYKHSAVVSSDGKMLLLKKQTKG
jgi:hypothetical protein